MRCGSTGADPRGPRGGGPGVGGRAKGRHGTRAGFISTRERHTVPDTRAARMERGRCRRRVAPARRAAADAARADAARALGGVRGEFERRFDAQVSTRDVGRNADAAAVDAIENGSHPRPFANASAPPACDSVLIVDDDKVNVKVLHRAFSKGSFGTVTTGEDGQDAVQLLINQDAKFDVVLIDENMRHMNGTVATERVRAREAQNGCSGRQLVVVTSGNSRTAIRSSIRRQG